MTPTERLALLAADAVIAMAQNPCAPVNVDALVAMKRGIDAEQRGDLQAAADAYYEAAGDRCPTVTGPDGGIVVPTRIALGVAALIPEPVETVVERASKILAKARADADLGPIRAAIGGIGAHISALKPDSAAATDDEFFRGIWWVPDEAPGVLRPATGSECAAEIRRLRAELQESMR